MDSRTRGRVKKYIPNQVHPIVRHDEKSSTSVICLAKGKFVKSMDFLAYGPNDMYARCSSTLIQQSGLAYSAAPGL